MGFHVDYDALDEMYSGMYSNADAWRTTLVELSSKLAVLVQSANMDGAGADSIKTYLDSTHNTIIPILSSLIAAHIENCLLYVRNYQSGIDTDLHTIIDEDELEVIKNNLSIQSAYSTDIHDIVQATLNEVSDIVYVECPDNSAVEDNHAEVGTLISNLLNSIRELEENHYSNDFIDTSELISALTSFINERLCDSRSYKTDFSIETLANSASFLTMYKSYMAVNAQIEANKDAVTVAIDEENSRIEALQAEIEERQRKAEIEKWAVTGLCVVGSIVAVAAIVATGGTATPLVVGAVSAVSGAIIAGNNAAADEYVANGWDMSQWDMKSIATSALIGEVSGFITGYVGAGVSSAISSGLSSAGSTLLNSSSMAVRVGSNAAIGATSEVVSGVASRGAVTFTTTMIYSGGDISTSVDSALGAATDLKQIAFDATLGGIVGGIRGVKKPTTVDTIKVKKEYQDDLLKRSEYADTIDNANFEKTWEVRSAEENKLMRKEFNDVKDDLISQWEKKTNKKWPTYDSDIYTDNGKLLRKKGSRYDAHHIQPLTYGGSNTASNITPLHALEHFDHKGIHASGTPYEILEALLK